MGNVCALPRLTFFQWFPGRLFRRSNVFDGSQHTIRQPSSHIGHSGQKGNEFVPNQLGGDGCGFLLRKNMQLPGFVLFIRSTEVSTCLPLHDMYSTYYCTSALEMLL